jgi:hypothetical protein
VAWPSRRRPGSSRSVVRHSLCRWRAVARGGPRRSCRLNPRAGGRRSDRRRDSGVGTADGTAADGRRVAAAAALPSEHAAGHPGVRLLVGSHRGGRVHAAPPGEAAQEGTAMSAEHSRGVETVVGYPPLVEMDDRQRRELQRDESVSRATPHTPPSADEDPGEPKEGNNYVSTRQASTRPGNSPTSRLPALQGRTRPALPRRKRATSREPPRTDRARPPPTADVVEPGTNPAGPPAAASRRCRLPAGRRVVAVEARTATRGRATNAVALSIGATGVGNW